jgi:DNA polymerase theta
MNWGMMAAVLDHMRDRLEAGARADLLEMAQVTFVKSWTARLLRDNGFKNLRALAEAEPKDLVPVLMMVGSLDFLAAFLGFVCFFVILY